MISRGWVPFILMLAGIGGVCSSLLFPALYRCSPRYCLYADIIVLTGVLFLMDIPFSETAALRIAGVCGLVMVFTVFQLILQSRIFILASGYADLANSLFSSVFNVGIGMGALAGGRLLNVGADVDRLGFAGAFLQQRHWHRNGRFSVLRTEEICRRICRRRGEKMIDICGLGTLAADILMKVDRLPGKDDFGIVQSTDSQPGGSGTNVAVQAARLGSRCAYIGCTGDDEPGKVVRDSLVKEKIDIDGMQVLTGGVTTHTDIVVDKEGQKFILLTMGDAFSA